MDLITGNRFLDIANIEFDGSGFIGRNQEKKLLDPVILFCETHNLKNLFAINIPYYFILISHNSDGCIVPVNWRKFDFHFEQTKLQDNIVVWYAQNMNVLSPKIRPLPIGLENFKWHKGKKWQELTQVSTQRIPRSGMVYMNFEVSTNPAERNLCFNTLRTKPFVTRAMTKVSYLEYITAMKRHYYVACPEGNGYDTHRMWEALYMGCIPIARKRVFTQMFSRIFPMYLVDDWNEVTRERLVEFKNSQKTVELLEKTKAHLNFSFWEKVVKGDVTIQ
jgi:hypothetical protein